MIPLFSDKLDEFIEKNWETYEPEEIITALRKQLEHVEALSKALGDEK